MQRELYGSRIEVLYLRYVASRLQAAQNVYRRVSKERVRVQKVRAAKKIQQRTIRVRDLLRCENTNPIQRIATLQLEQRVKASGVPSSRR